MASKGQTRGSTLLALAIGLLPQAPLAPAALAQATTAETPAVKPGIRVAPVILAEPEVETSINIQVGPEGGIPRQTFLRIRGMPLAAKLSDGHVVSPGIWAVPLAALPSLRLLAPLSSSGRTEIQLSLVGVDGGVLAESKSSLVVAPAWLLGSSGQRQDVTRGVPQARPEPAAEPPAKLTPPAAAATVVEARTIPAVTGQPRAAAPAPVAPPPQTATRPEAQAAVVAALPPPAATEKPSSPVLPPPATRAAPPEPAAVAPAAAPALKAPPQLTAADRERAEAMVQRGDAFWRQGNFAAARQFFRRAADMGLAGGALRMGATYDPVELKAIAVVGLDPDPKEASLWYERARELGAPEASARLARMQTR